MTQSASVAHRSFETFFRGEEAPIQAPVIPIRQVREPVATARFSVISNDSDVQKRFPTRRNRELNCRNRDRSLANRGNH